MVKPVISIYNWSKNFSHTAYENSKAKMAAIDVEYQNLDIYMELSGSYWCLRLQTSIT
jgi:hypothetical protein